MKNHAFSVIRCIRSLVVLGNCFQLSANETKVLQIIKSFTTFAENDEIPQGKLHALVNEWRIF